MSAADGEVCSSPRAEDLQFEQHGDFLSGYMPHRIFFTYLKCRECGAHYCPLYYSAEQLRQLYERQPENMADVPLGSRARTQAGYLEILRRYSRMAGGLLEIGADIGLFAQACADAGQFDRLWLAEPNRARSCAARATLRGPQCHDPRCDVAGRGSAAGLRSRPR